MKPVMAIEMRRTAMMRDLTVLVFFLWGQPRWDFVGEVVVAGRCFVPFLAMAAGGGGLWNLCG